MAGDDDQGGAGRINAFAMFLSDDRELDYRFKRLLAHEAFHTWNGAKIRRRDPEVLVYSMPARLCAWRRMPSALAPR
jgi:predicted metalloprotease with PDZ domain